MRKLTAGPSADLIARGLKAVSVIDSSRDDAPGELLEEDGRHVLARFCTNPRRHIWSIRNLRRKPEFVVSDSAGLELLKICRTARLQPAFAIVQNERTVGQIRVRSPLRNRYTITLKSGPVWSFRMPLYRVLFHGCSDTGSEIWVSVGDGGKRHWNILLAGDVDHHLLLSAIAFIHREWWCYA